MKRIVLAWCFLLFVASAASAASGAGPAGFSLTDHKGKTHTLEGYKGKWVVVNFWATWCPPCLKEIPDFAALYDARKGKNLMMIGVAVDYNKPQEVIDFAETLLMTYPLVLGDKNSEAQFGRMRALPSTFIYNPQGKLVLQRTGTLSKEELSFIVSGK